MTRSMANPTVSIIVPTYHSLATLPRMIESIKTQSYPDWELIIVDGTSNDGTAELMADAKRDLGDQLTFIEQVNQGCCVARNTGIDAARGQYIAFLDSDDELLPNKLERQLELFRARPDLGLVYSDCCYLDTEGQYHPSVWNTHAPVAREVPTEIVGHNLHVCTPDLFDYLIRAYFIATIVGMVRHDALDDIRFITDNPFGFSEWIFYLDIVRKHRAGFVDEPLSLHHHTDGSITRTSKLRNYESHRALLQTIRARYPHLSADARRALDAQSADTCAQIAYHHFKQADYPSATRFFTESITYRFNPSTATAALKSATATLLRS